MRVSEIMATPVIVIGQDASLEDAARMMLDNRVGGLPVIDAEGKLVGIITESDFTARESGIPFSTFRAPRIFGQWLPREGVEQIYAAARAMKAKEIMSHPVMTLTENDSVEDALRLMLDDNLKRVPVVRDGVPVGMVTRLDVLRLMMHRS